MKRIQLWNESVEWGSDLCNGTLVDAIKTLQSMADRVPPEHLDSVKFEFENEDYDAPSIYLKIYYDREETPEEIEDARLETERRVQAAAERTRLQELAALAALKAKYPDA